MGHYAFQYALNACHLQEVAASIGRVFSAGGRRPSLQLARSRRVWAVVVAVLPVLLGAAVVPISASSLHQSEFLYPTNGTPDMVQTVPFQWTPNTNALVYYLYVGTSQGAKDIAESGEIQATSFTVKGPLPAGTTLWAR